MSLKAFILGLIGSFHCVAMCGPLVAIFSFRSKNILGVFQSLIYQLSRISVYVSLGALVGGLMSGADWLGVSQKLSVILGGVFLTIGVVYLLIKPAGVEQFAVGKWVTKAFGLLMKNEKIGLFRFVFSGMANGLLPCGMVYVALAGTTISLSATEGALYMLSFGLGTLPALTLVGAVSNWIKQQLSFVKSKFIISGFLLITGAMMLLRGLNLGIDVVSPEIKPAQQTTNCYVNE